MSLKYEPSSEPLHISAQCVWNRIRIQNMRFMVWVGRYQANKEQRLKDFYPKVNARIWPWLSYMCRFGSTAGNIYGLTDSGLVGSTDSGRGAARAEGAQGTPTQSHISPSIPVYEDYEDLPSSPTASGRSRADLGGEGHRGTSLIRKRPPPRTALGP